MLLQSLTSACSLTQFHVLRQYVVTFGAVSRKLAVAVPLENVRPRQYEILDYLIVSAMRSEMKRCPLLDASGHIQVEDVV